MQPDVSTQASAAASPVPTMLFTTPVLQPFTGSSAPEPTHYSAKQHDSFTSIDPVSRDDKITITPTTTPTSDDVPAKPGRTLW